MRHHPPQPMRASLLIAAASLLGLLLASQPLQAQTPASAPAQAPVAAQMPTVAATPMAAGQKTANAGPKTADKPAGQAPATLQPPATRPPSQPDDAPIPDVPTLMRQVEANQKNIDEIRKDYRYHAFETDQDLDGKGNVKKTETEEREIFYVNGQHIERTLKRDGKDLSPKEQQKEQERVDKEIAAAREAKDGPKKDHNGNTILSVSRLLELGTVSAPRRVIMNGRRAIVFDFTGNTKAKTSNMSEGVMKDLSGTVWIDEDDHQVTRMEARFEQNFHIGGGMLVNIQKGTSFTFEQARINNEVWLPTSIEGQGSARVLLVKAFNGSMRTVFSDYHKFTADVKILPGAIPVASQPAQAAPAHP